MADFTTLSSAWINFFTYMQILVGAAGDGGDLTIKKVVEGEHTASSYNKAFVSLQLLKSQVTSRTDNNKVWKQELKIVIFSNALTRDGATSEILAKMAQVEDAIEAYIKPDAVEGFEDADWGITFDSDTNAGSSVSAESTRNFTVIVARGGN